MTAADDKVPRGRTFTEKVLAGVEEASAVAARLRGAGKTVVFTNGCFDILHVGHIRCLEGARSLGDYLFVGVNSDASVRAIKGEGRPVTPEGERLEVLSALDAVGFLFLFDGETADEVILKVRPDIHAKGTDYTEENVPERESVLSYGGRIAIVGDPKSHSTRDILGKLKA
ncbi:MAG: adenylyltransferase/cytidyltransferase family protein [Planctomycetota bacterium]|jgi:rfaE bifunctional protein nucleotidyltransferase chain/domain